MTITIPICFTCKHYNTELNNCPAYPHGVPDDMLLDADKHDKPRPDQHGDTVYEEGTPINEKKG